MIKKLKEIESIRAPPIMMMMILVISIRRLG